MVATQQIGSDELVPEVRMPGSVVDLEQGLGRNGDTQFLVQFPNGRTQVILARVYMAGARRTEQARAIILGIGTPLEAELPVTPDPKDMDRSWSKPRRWISRRNSRPTTSSRASTTSKTSSGDWPTSEWLIGRGP